jgi:hypothetical protein
MRKDAALPLLCVCVCVFVFFVNIFNTQTHAPLIKAHLTRMQLHGSRHSRVLLSALRSPSFCILVLALWTAYPLLLYFSSWQALIVTKLVEDGPAAKSGAIGQSLKFPTALFQHACNKLTCDHRCFALWN